MKRWKLMPVTYFCQARIFLWPVSTDNKGQVSFRLVTTESFIVCRKMGFFSE